MNARRLEGWAKLPSLAGAAFGVAASVGWIPARREGWLQAVAGGALLLLGAAAGRLLRARQDQIDRRRAERGGDPLATKPERELAHREAEEERKVAARWCLLAALLPTFGLTAWLRDPERLGFAELLWLPPLLGFAAAFLVKRPRN